MRQKRKSSYPFLAHMLTPRTWFAILFTGFSEKRFEAELLELFMGMGLLGICLGGVEMGGRIGLNEGPSQGSNLTSVMFALL